MKKLLNKEITIKTNVWRIVVEILLYSIILTIVLHEFVGDCNDELIKLLTMINTHNNALKFSLLAFPIILLIVTVIKITYYATSNDEIVKTNKKRKK